MTIKKFISLERLTKYNELIDTKISEGDESTLTAAKSYTDTKVAKLVDNSTAAIDSITELAAGVEDNANAIEALETKVGDGFTEITSEQIRALFDTGAQTPEKD